MRNKGNNKIPELRTILQRESQNSKLYKQTKSVNNRNTEFSTALSTILSILFQYCYKYIALL
jgi:hypothetical protein